MAEAIATFFGRFTVLKSAGRELWLTFLAKFLAVAGYKLINVTLVLWLSADFGFDDKAAMHIVLIWSVSMSVTVLLVGSLTDAIGLRKTFFLGVTICVLSRLVMVFTTVKGVAFVCGLLPLAVGEALTTPVLVAAVRKYSTTSQRSMAFSVFYIIMNLGFLVAGYLFDFVRDQLGEYGHLRLPVVGITITTYRAMMLLSLAIELTLLPVIYFVRRGAEMTDEGLRIVPEQIKYPDSSLWHSMWLTVRDGACGTASLFAGLLKQTAFYRLLGFLALIAFLKVIFMQIDYVFPKFGIRELGLGAPIGKLLGLNNWLIILIVPFVGAMTQRFQAYHMVVVGGIISAASVFIMALPTVWFQSLADGPFGHWLGHYYLRMPAGAVIHPYYVMTVFFVILLSLGEAFYSPRVYEYAAAIAPKGQEASYSALSYIPLLLAKLLAGSVGGELLAAYCPEVGPRQSGLMWLFVALMVTVAPVGLIVLRRFIQVREAGRG